MIKSCYKIQDQKGDTVETYSVAMHSKVDSLIGESPTEEEARTKINNARYEREQIRISRTLDQNFFVGDRERATEVLRSIVREAEVSILFVDPYFTATEIYRFALATSFREVPIRILTWGGVLKIGKRRAHSVLEFIQRFFKRQKVFESSKGETLLKEIQKLSCNPSLNSIQARVMRGKTPDIHDRFIVVDNKVWLMGSSFNNFGDRGTILLSLPDPEPVRRTLETVWEGSINLETWVTQKRTCIEDEDSDAKA